MLLAFCASRGYQAPTPGGMPVIAGARALPWYRVTQGMGMATTEQSIVDTHAEAGVRRRDFINIAAVSFVGVGAAPAVVPLVTQMNPQAVDLAADSIEVYIQAYQPEKQFNRTGLRSLVIL